MVVDHSEGGSTAANGAADEGVVKAEGEVMDVDEAPAETSV